MKNYKKFITIVGIMRIKNNRGSGDYEIKQNLQLSNNFIK